MHRTVESSPLSPHLCGNWGRLLRLARLFPPRVCRVFHFLPVAFSSYVASRPLSPMYVNVCMCMYVYVCVCVASPLFSFLPFPLLTTVRLSICVFRRRRSDTGETCMASTSLVFAAASWKNRSSTPSTRTPSPLPLAVSW